MATKAASTKSKKVTTSTKLAPTPAQITPDDRALLDGVRRRFAEVATAGTPLFTTDAEGLWTLFLFNIPAELRPIYTCHACRRFVQKYGGLVAIDDQGLTVPALWALTEGVPGPFADAIMQVARQVRAAKIEGVFLSKETVWGTPVTGPWEHMSVAPTRAPFRHVTLTAGQMMAEKRQDFITLKTALAEFPIAVVRNAVQILSSGDHLYRSEKVAGVADWLLALHEAREKAHGQARDNVVWRAVATAPPGFAHIRSSMIGTLLADLAQGLEFYEVKNRFDAKMHPLKYQRPTAAPSDGQIAQAEKIVDAMEAAGSLRRRFARLEDVTALWRPAAPRPAAPLGEGVFQHLRQGRGASHQAVETPASAMTWEKFARTVLPEAETIEFLVPREGGQPFIALVTAMDPAAPPILQWDATERRNPVGWYVYNGGSAASDWNLTAGAWAPVTAVCLLPPQWGQDTPREHWGEGVILLLGDARDKRYKGAGAGFFPETLRSEFHGVRKTLEAYAMKAEVYGKDEATACGIDLRKGLKWSQTVRVTSPSGRAQYRLDRWD